MERAQLLKEARLKKRLTYEQAAERFGVDPSTVKRWENGKSTPQPINLYNIAEIYSITLEELGFHELPSAEGTPVATQNATTFDEEEEEDATTSFHKQDLTSRLMYIVWNWLISCHHARYQELQTLITLELEGYGRMHPDNINRRNALRRMALFAIDLCALSARQPVIKRPVEEILTYCASGIVACWYLRKGKELAFADDAVSKYIPTLKELAKSAPEPQQKEAADLLAQCLLLKAPLAWALKTPHDSVIYAQQAEIYGEQAGSLLLRILALRAQAAAHYYANHWMSALQTAEKAKSLLEERDKRDKQKQLSVSQPAEEPIPQLVHSYIYAGLATYQARNGYSYKDDALLSLKKAHRTFSDEQAPIWIDHNQANLILNDGMTHYHLGLCQSAIGSFAQISTIPTRSESIYVEALIDQVMAEVSRDDRLRDMAFCIDHWTQGIQQAKALQSQQRINESIQAFTAMCIAWPGEQQIKNLREYIVH